MTEILKVESLKQESQEYGDRYVVAVITDLYYYEFIYRFPEGDQAHMTVSRSTYGNIHEKRSGRTLVLNSEGALRKHAKKMAVNMEDRPTIREQADQEKSL